MKHVLGAMLFAALLLAGCATAPPPQVAQPAAEAGAEDGLGQATTRSYTPIIRRR